MEVDAIAETPHELRKPQSLNDELNPNDVWNGFANPFTVSSSFWLRHSFVIRHSGFVIHFIRSASASIGSSADGFAAPDTGPKKTPTSCAEKECDERSSSSEITRGPVCMNRVENLDVPMPHEDADHAAEQLSATASTRNWKDVVPRARRPCGCRSRASAR